MVLKTTEGLSLTEGIQLCVSRAFQLSFSKYSSLPIVKFNNGSNVLVEKKRHTDFLVQVSQQ